MADTSLLVVGQKDHILFQKYVEEKNSKFFLLTKQKITKFNLVKIFVVTLLDSVMPTWQLHKELQNDN